MEGWRGGSDILRYGLVTGLVRSLHSFKISDADGFSRRYTAVCDKSIFETTMISSSRVPQLRVP